MDDILGCQEGLPGPPAAKTLFPHVKSQGLGVAVLCQPWLECRVSGRHCGEDLLGFRRPRGSFPSRGKGCHAEWGCLQALTALCPDR